MCAKNIYIYIAEDDEEIEIVKVWDIFFPLILEMEFGRRYLLE
jgi:hypothetical protein